MSTREDFEPTTIREVLHEALTHTVEYDGLDTEIRIASGPGKEWGILSIYENDGYIWLDVVPLEAEGEEL